MSTCVICTGDRQAHVGFLCLGHLERLGAMLREVEDQAAMLDARPSMAIRTGSGGGSLASERAPARLDIIAFGDPRTRRWEPDDEPRYVPPAPKAIGPWCLFCDHDTCTDWRAGRRRDLHDDEQDAGSAALASVLDELHNWARLIREERDLSSPGRVTVTGERDLLTRQLEWIAEQPWVDELYSDVRTLLGQLKGANGTAADKPVGRCYLPAENGTCGGVIRRAPGIGTPWLTLADRCERQDLETADGHAYCDGCGQTWDGPQLAMLSFEMERAKAEASRPRTEDGRRMLTAQEMADRLGIKVGNFRVFAHRRRIRAVNGHYDPEDFRERMSA